MLALRRLAMAALVRCGGAASQPATSHAATARTARYSGGMMMAADPTGGYWTVTPAGAVTPHGAASGLGLARRCRACS